MDVDCHFYICPVCFAVSETVRTCHGQSMIHCGELEPGDSRLKPLLDGKGELKSRAPRWFLQSLKERQSK